MLDSSTGLSLEEVRRRRAEYGPNTIEEKKRSLMSRLVHWVATPMSLMFAVAGGLSFFAGNDADAYIIAALFLVNVGIGAWHEAKADTAIEKLREKLAVMVKAMRGGAWLKVPSSELVPGDVIELASGDLVPADVSFLVAKNVSVNEAVVTGESLPKQKSDGDTAYSGSFLATGLGTATVTATGARTYFGKTLSLVEAVRPRSQLEKDIFSISKFLSVVSVVVMVVLTIVLLAAHEPILEIATLDVSMLIAGIPVALPTVMTLIISVGIVELAKKAVIVRRLSALEDLADVNLLLSDKTGTLTENRIGVDRMEALVADMPEGEIWARALAAAPRADGNPLDAAIQAKTASLGIRAIPVLDFIPGDSDRKRTTAFVAKDGARRAIALGAPQTVKELCRFDGQLESRYDELVAEAAREGFRVLALAESDTDVEKDMRPLAVLFLSDAVRADAGQTIRFLQEQGIGVKMVTGDGADVASHVAHELGLSGRIVRRSELGQDAAAIKAGFASFAGFAEVMPKDKYDLVMMAKSAEKPYVVAVTGDGVNDVPPVRAADVGIAVANAVDALKGTADIVLTKAGISVIMDAIIESRKIFMRLYNYSVYRISESFRLIITIAVIGVLFHAYPLTPVQIILIALLNDAPIISLAFDRVAVPQRPVQADVRKRLSLSLLFGSVGIANSLLLLWVATAIFHAPWALIQTLFFLKLTIGGHMLVYVAHTEKLWYKFLPSKQVIWATAITQGIATILALTGTFVAALPWQYVAFVWLWAFFWMQASELAKICHQRLSARASAMPAVSDGSEPAHA